MMKSTENPKTLVIVTPGLDCCPARAAARIKYRNPSLLHGEDYGDLDTIASAVQNHAKKYGTLDEVVILSHGGPYTLHPYLFKQTDVGNIADFFELIGAKQKENSNLVLSHRYVFLTCNAFSDLVPYEIENIMQTASKLGSEIVGSTSMLSACLTRISGNFIKFSPDETVCRDALTSHYDIGAWLNQRESSRWGFSAEWFAQFQKKQRAASQPTPTL